MCFPLHQCRGVSSSAMHSMSSSIVETCIFYKRKQRRCHSTNSLRLRVAGPQERCPLALMFRPGLRQVEDYIHVFEPYQETYRANSEHVTRVKEAYRDSSLAEFHREVEKYKGMTIEFESIPACATVSNGTASEQMFISKLRSETVPSKGNGSSGIKQ